MPVSIALALLSFLGVWAVRGNFTVASKLMALAAGDSISKYVFGVVTGSSVLGMLIPPSLLLILFGILTETSIGDLFTAGILPGVLLAGAFCLFILVMATWCPNRVFGLHPPEAAPVEEQMTFLGAVGKLIPIAALITLVLGGIYLGWFAPTESGAVGA